MTAASELDDLGRAVDELHEALAVAFRLSRRAQKAGLVVTRLAPHRCQGKPARR